MVAGLKEVIGVGANSLWIKASNWSGVSWISRCYLGMGVVIGLGVQDVVEGAAEILVRRETTPVVVMEVEWGFD
jgi:hypothetical protein